MNGFIMLRHSVLALVYVVVSATFARVAAAEETGPRMTDAELFEALDLDYAGLEAVKAAWTQGKIQDAKGALAAYFRKREKPIWFASRWSSRNPERDRERAKVYMDREFRVIGVTHRFGKGNDIDWALNPTGGESGLPFNPEWTWQFSRHSFWYRLGSAYHSTGDEAYAREFAYQLSDWIADCPRPLEGRVDAVGSRWRTIETGIRGAGSWPAAFFAFRESPSLDDGTLLKMVKVFAEHAYHLMPESRFKSTSNWGTMESNGLFCVGVLFPEFKEAEMWRDTAISRLHGELDKQVYPDGMQIELTSGYHQVSLRNMVQPLRVARLNGIEIPEDYLTKLERMYHFNLYAARPDGRLPGLNDGGRTDVRRYLREGAEFFPERTDFLWMATGGEEGTRPAHDSYPFPYSGYMVMRSGWDLDDLYMLFDVGPYGRSHQHEDKLSLVTYAYGRHHIIDPGNYTYERSKWRSFILTSAAHNTVLVDGMGQGRRGQRETYVVEEPLPHTWISEPAFDYAAGIYEDGYRRERERDSAMTRRRREGSRRDRQEASDSTTARRRREGYRRDREASLDRTVTHRRRVLFVKPQEGMAGYWVVSDLLTPSDDASHRYEALFHLAVSPDSVAADPENHRVLTQNPVGSNFAIWPAPLPGLSGTVLAGQEEPVLRGWQRGPGRGPEKPAPLPVASYTFEATGTARAMYILYPVAEGETLPIRSVETVRVEGGGMAVKASFADGRVHYVAQSDAVGGALRFAGMETDAEAALVALTPSGDVERTIVVRGEALKREGKDINRGER